MHSVIILSLEYTLYRKKKENAFLLEQQSNAGFTKRMDLGKT